MFILEKETSTLYFNYFYNYLLLKNYNEFIFNYLIIIYYQKKYKYLNEIFSQNYLYYSKKNIILLVLNY
jgi:hypothetical protein